MQDLKENILVNADILLRVQNILQDPKWIAEMLEDIMTNALHDNLDLNAEFSTQRGIGTTSVSNAYNRIRKIYKVLTKEIYSKYIFKCNNCGKIYYLQRKPRLRVEDYICGNCGSKGSFQFLSVQ